MIPQSQFTIQLVDQLSKFEFVLAVLFLATAYLLGLVSSVISRGIIDYLSEKFPRPMLISLLSHKSCSEVKERLASYDRHPSLPSIEREDEKRFWKTEVRLAWNKAYRGVLAEVTRSGPEKGILEVQRRREQGRLVRNLFFPLLVTTLVITRSVIQVDRGWKILLSIVFISVGSVFLYAYAEYFNYAEAILHLYRDPQKLDHMLSESRVQILEHVEDNHECTTPTT